MTAVSDKKFELPGKGIADKILYYKSRWFLVIWFTSVGSLILLTRNLLMIVSCPRTEVTPLHNSSAYKHNHCNSTCTYSYKRGTCEIPRTLKRQKICLWKSIVTRDARDAQAIRLDIPAFFISRSGRILDCPAGYPVRAGYRISG
jgi:hypothetical protein